MSETSRTLFNNLRRTEFNLPFKTEGEMRNQVVYICGKLEKKGKKQCKMRPGLQHIIPQEISILLKHLQKQADQYREVVVEKNEAMKQLFQLVLFPEISDKGAKSGSHMIVDAIRERIKEVLGREIEGRGSLDSVCKSIREDYVDVQRHHATARAWQRKAGEHAIRKINMNAIAYLPSRSTRCRFSICYFDFISLTCGTQSKSIPIWRTIFSHISILLMVNSL